jgi:hypothetical protein
MILLSTIGQENAELLLDVVLAAMSDRKCTVRFWILPPVSHSVTSILGLDTCKHLSSEQSVGCNSV